jgi:hypothetical protein
MLHCVNFKHNKVLFLFDNSTFRHRYIKVGYCPKCKRTVIELHEERKIDGKIFVEQKVGVEAINFLAKARTNIDYVSGKNKEKNFPIGWVFGVNVETKQGIKQYSSDFKGNKELIKVINE